MADSDVNPCPGPCLALALGGLVLVLGFSFHVSILDGYFWLHGMNHVSSFLGIANFLLVLQLQIDGSRCLQSEYSKCKLTLV